MRVLYSRGRQESAYGSCYLIDGEFCGSADVVFWYVLWYRCFLVRLRLRRLEVLWGEVCGFGLMGFWADRLCEILELCGLECCVYGNRME